MPAFLLLTPTSWFFQLAFLLSNPVFATRLCNKLPEWFFLLAFLFLRPRHGVSHLLFYSRAQFLLRDCTISFQSGGGSLTFLFLCPCCGFSVYFSTPAPSFPLWIARLASKVGFHTCSPLPTPTVWFSFLSFLLPYPVIASIQGNNLLKCFLLIHSFSVF